MPESAGRVVLRARRTAALSQAQLAQRAGMTQSEISAYERGRREPGLATLQRIVAAAGFDITIDLTPRTRTIRGLLGERSEEITQLCGRHGASNPRVFGSVARGEDRHDSDIDVLVDLDPRADLLDLAALEIALERLLGREVDVIPADSLRGASGERMRAEAVAL